MPVRNWRHGDTGSKAVRVGHRIQSETAAPAPTPPAQAVFIQLRIIPQHIVEYRELVFKLDRSEVVVRRLRKGPAPMAHAAIVGAQHREALLWQQFVEQQI